MPVINSERGVCELHLRDELKKKCEDHFFNSVIRSFRYFICYSGRRNLIMSWLKKGTF